MDALPAIGAMVHPGHVIPSGLAVDLDLPGSVVALRSRLEGVLVTLDHVTEHGKEIVARALLRVELDPTPGRGLALRRRSRVVRVIIAEEEFRCLIEQVVAGLETPGSRGGGYDGCAMTTTLI